MMCVFVFNSTSFYRQSHSVPKYGAICPFDLSRLKDDSYSIGLASIRTGGFPEAHTYIIARKYGSEKFRLIHSTQQPILWKVPRIYDFFILLYSFDCHFSVLLVASHYASGTELLATEKPLKNN